MSEQQPKPPVPASERVLLYDLEPPKGPERTKLGRILAALESITGGGGPGGSRGDGPRFR